jgi:Flp pilus assembly pilin Flp
MKRNSICRMARRFRRAQGGNAGVEFALLLPLLALILFGTIEFGRVWHDFHIVNQSVRDAARYLGRLDYTCTGSTGCGTCDPTTGVCSGGPCTINDPNDVLEGVNLAMTGSVSGGQNLLSSWNQPSSLTINLCAIANPIGTSNELQGLYLDQTSVPYVELAADVPFNFLFGELAASAAQITIGLEHKVVMVGQGGS